MIERGNMEGIVFSKDGLVPCVVQDAYTKEVLMMAYMNKESLERTIEEGYSCFYSRTRKTLWKKGETSGNVQKVRGLYYDCDGDTLLLKVQQKGPACHTGKPSCFFNELIREDTKEKSDVMDRLYSLLCQRRKNPVEGSYTSYLFNEGIDKILKKVGEESAEVIIASKSDDRKETVYEIADLFYHVLVLMVNQEISMDDIRKELESRRK